MTGTRIKSAVGVGVTLALVVGLVASTGVASVFAAHSSASVATIDDDQAQNTQGAQYQMNNSTDANTSAPSPATMGTLNNSTMADMSKDELVTRALELQHAISATQDQYLTQIRALELQLNAVQQGDEPDANVTGVLPAANQTPMNATQQGQTKGIYLNKSALSELSHDKLMVRILDLQEVETQTQQQYLKQIRALQLQLNTAQNQSQEQVSAPAPSNQTTQNATPAGGNGKAKTGNGKAKTGSGNQMG